MRLSPHTDAVHARPRTIEELNAGIQALLHADSDHEVMDQIADALRQVGPQVLSRHLTTLLSQPDALRDIAARSYLHGNGFYKIPLVDAESHVLRLHVWESNADAEENLHSHRWPFASAIVLGSLTSELWVDAIGPGTRAFPELIYRGKNRPFEPAEECRVRLKDVRRHETGEHYSMMADELHRIVNVGDALTATIMVRPRETRSWSRNILVTDTFPNAKPTYLSTAQLCPLLKKVLVALVVPRPDQC